MGDRLGTPGAVGFLSESGFRFFTHFCGKIYENILRIYISSPTDCWWLPAEIAISRVKQHWSRILLGWETAWEHRVLLGFFSSLKERNLLYKYVSVKLAERSKASDLRSDTFSVRGFESLTWHTCLEIGFWQSQVGRAVQGVRFKIWYSQSARVRIPHLTREVFKIRFISKTPASDLF